MVLTKACFLHQDFLHYYAGTKLPDLAQLSSSMPPALPASPTATSSGKSKHSYSTSTATATSWASSWSSVEALNQVRAYIDEVQSEQHIFVVLWHKKKKNTVAA
jgi:hypothetical protein